MSPLSNAERQARHRQRQRYDRELVQRQMAIIEVALNELQKKAGLPEIQLPKSVAFPEDD